MIINPLKMKSIKIQKRKSIQKTPVTKSLKDQKLIKLNNNTLDNNFKYKLKIKSSNKNNSHIHSSHKNNESSNTSLISAIESNNIKKVEEIIKKNTSSINKLNSKGFSPLHISVIKGNIKIINFLLKNGAKINILSSTKKQTPLHLAYMNLCSNSKDIIKLLLNNGADDSILDISNKKPSDYELKMKITNINNNLNKNKCNSNNINLNKNQIKKLKKRIEKDGYKGNTYNLKDSKDNSFVIITMDNISYLTSDENTIFQISDINTKTNSISINENSKVEIKNNSIDNTNDNNILKDSLDEDNTLETKKVQYDTNNFFKKNELVDSLEISDEPKTNINNKYINSKEKTPNEFENKYSSNLSNYCNNIKKNNNFLENNPANNLDGIFKSLIANKRNSFFKLTKHNSSANKDKFCNSIRTNRHTCSSHYENTDNSTNKLIPNSNSLENTDEKMNKKSSSIIQYGKINNEFNLNSTYKTNRNSFNSIVSTISQTNKKRNYKKAKNFTKNNEIKINFSQINKNCSFLLNWLINLQLSSYYKNFLDSEIYDINKLVEQMNTPNKFNYDDIESILLIHIPGHIFRILTQLEVDAGLIDKSIVNFMINNNKGEFENSYIGKKVIFSYGEKYNFNCCYNFDKLDICGCGGNNGKKNDLKSFLMRYNLLNLYQNFCHNGFDLINYVILQMYGSYPINSDILENNFHIYDENQRNLVLKALEKEVNKINNFLCSEKYYENENSYLAKYDKVIFDKDLNLNNISEIRIDNKKDECLII